MKCSNVQPKIAPWRNISSQPLSKPCRNILTLCTLYILTHLLFRRLRCLLSSGSFFTDVEESLWTVLIGCGRGRTRRDALKIVASACGVNLSKRGPRSFLDVCISCALLKFPRLYLVSSFRYSLVQDRSKSSLVGSVISTSTAWWEVLSLVQSK